MTEETPGFEENKPDVPSGATPDAEQQQAQAAQPQPQQQPEAAEQPQPAPEQAQQQSAPAGDASAQIAALTAQLDQTRQALEERTGDLQRLQAEFQNYRRRVERDRIAVKEIAVANLLTEILPVLDDIGRAREHGELVGGFKSVAESLETVVAKMGLQQFGKEGEPFDPTVHEALMHSYAPDVTETTCVAILQPGYRIGERTIRPARVAVAEPQPGAQTVKAEESSSEAGDEKDNGPEEG